MSPFWIPLFASLVAGLATGLGALPLLFFKSFSERFISGALAFSAGIMLVAAFLSLIVPGLEMAPKIYSPHWHTWPLILGVLLGYLVIVWVHERLPHSHFIKDPDMSHQKNWKRVTLIVLAIALHNFPEGLAVGVGFGGDELSRGYQIAIAIALQNIPEGLVVAVGLLSIGASRAKAMLMALLSGLVEPAGALVGILFTQLGQWSLPVSLGFAGGAMLFVICQEMFPEIFKPNHEKVATFGLLSGVLLMLLIGSFL